MFKFFKVLVLSVVVLSGCAVNWKAKGFESEDQYKLASARALSPYGAKLFFGYGIKDEKQYDSAIAEMNSAKYAQGKSSEDLASYLKDKEEGAKDGMSAYDYREKQRKIKAEAEAAIKKQRTELASKIMDRHWANSQNDCVAGNYTVFTSKSPGVSYFARGKDLSGGGRVDISYGYQLPNKMTLVRKVYAAPMVANLAGDPDTIAMDMSTEIEVKSDNTLFVSTKYKQVNLDDLLARKTYLDILRSPPKYDIKNESSNYILCK